MLVSPVLKLHLCSASSKTKWFWTPVWRSGLLWTLCGRAVLLQNGKSRSELIQRCGSYSVRCPLVLGSSSCLNLSSGLSDNENVSSSKGFESVDSELLLVYWVFKLLILYSKACFTRQAPLERFMAAVTEGLVNLALTMKLYQLQLSVVDYCLQCLW